MVSRSSKSLILFITPTQKVVNGGVMSIFSLTKESRKLQHIHNSSVELCVYPGDRSYKKNDLFDNEEYVYDFEQIMKKYPKLDRILIHVPELAVDKLNLAFIKYITYFENISDVHFNILNQNIKYMRNLKNISDIYKLADHVTQTTAHDKYATQETSNKYSLALKHLSVFIDPIQYQTVPYEKKKKLIAYSPDKSNMKELVIKRLVDSLPDYEFIEINNMTYEKYKTIIGKAKYVITFGEGLDGYLIESTFSGGIGVAVYNKDFFPSHNFKNESFIYPSYENMYENIVQDIKHADTVGVYNSVNQSMYKKLTDLYSYSRYVKNLTDFYKGIYDYIPSYSSAERLTRRTGSSLSEIATKLNEALAKNDSNIHRLKALELQNSFYKNKVTETQKKVNDIEASKSWRLTRPLRIIMNIVREFLK